MGYDVLPMRLFPRKKTPKDLPWSADGALARRAYPDYATYVSHQKAKLATIKGMEAYEREYRVALRSRLPAVPGFRVLCLAARTGTEVRAFRDAGARAVGIDLNPGSRNPDVLAADFHRLPFRTAAFDAAFSNSLDHALDLPRLARETARVVRPGGLFIVEAVAGSEEGPGPGSYESLFWKRIDDLIVALGRFGWRPGSRKPFDFPWRGEQIAFERES
ncbi:MAG: class I SAM-dependent methyltransferase [Planctomycetes bacterium]|nr:class I SAM-dependent methyltransferase [Planctomycetota bacterium]